ncbi:choice-of-anchor M domain-containing protein [Corynebacterium choanae]|uniref:ABC transporter-associated repeat protein n=1 Tax=Corynebacterium choanae TaxID=1862358 RepID=A0A3G6J5L5_9CORY|nr:choice-of-anchor M domain-containing protein [Corynebacterium choanae]AZA13347.1 hypothetical protein CCHOA_04695 [Corynebacterium choanae]
MTIPPLIRRIAALVTASLIIAAPTLTIPAAPAVAEPSTNTVEHRPAHRPGLGSSPVTLPADTVDTTTGSTHVCSGRKLLYHGHVDAAYITRDSRGELTIAAVDGAEVLPSDQVCMRLGPDSFAGREVSRMVVPDDPKLRFLGAPGTILWHAPFELTDGWRPIWAGFGAFDPTHEWAVPTDFVGNTIELSITDFSGPGDMEVFNYLPGWDRAIRLLSSSDIRRRTVEVGGHGHMNWTFSKPGIYTITWQARGRHFDGSIEQSAPITQYWLVGSDGDVHLPAGTSIGLGSTGTTAESIRESMGLAAPTTTGRQTPTITSTQPLIAETTLAQQYTAAWPPDTLATTITTGAVTNHLAYDEDDYLEPYFTTDHGDKLGSTVWLEIPDDQLVCADEHDPYLRELITRAGTNSFFTTAATAGESAAQLIFDTTGIDYTKLNEQKLIYSPDAATGAAGLIAIGVNTQGTFTPVYTTGGANTKPLQLFTADTHPVQALISAPGIYQQTITVRGQTPGGDYTSGWVNLRFIVGNETINYWRSKHGATNLLPTNPNRQCSRTITTADPFDYPILPTTATINPSNPTDPDKPATHTDHPTDHSNPHTPTTPAATHPTTPAEQPANEPGDTSATTADANSDTAATADGDNAATIAPPTTAPAAADSTNTPTPADQPDTPPASKPISRSERKQLIGRTWGPAAKALITQGHLDFALVGSTSAPQALLHDAADPVRPVYRPSGSFAVAVADSTLLSVPPALQQQLGFAREVYTLPQVQLPDQPWVGFSTDQLREQPTNGVTVSLQHFTGPGRMVTGHVLLTGEVAVGLDSADPTATVHYPRGSHDHQALWFAEPGLYKATFAYTFTDTAGVDHTTTLDAHFVVGDDWIQAAASHLKSLDTPAPVVTLDESTPVPDSSATTPPTETASEENPTAAPGEAHPEDTAADPAIADTSAINTPPSGAGDTANTADADQPSPSANSKPKQRTGQTSTGTTDSWLTAAATSGAVLAPAIVATGKQAETAAKALAHSYYLRLPQQQPAGQQSTPALPTAQPPGGSSHTSAPGSGSPEASGGTQPDRSPTAASHPTGAVAAARNSATSQQVSPPPQQTANATASSGRPVALRGKPASSQPHGATTAGQSTADNSATRSAVANRATTSTQSARATGGGDFHSFDAARKEQPTHLASTGNLEDTVAGGLIGFGLAAMLAAFGLLISVLRPRNTTTATPKP